MPVCINSVLHHLPMFSLWEKTFDTYKQIIAVICKKMLSSKKTNINNLMEKWAKDKNRQFIEKEMETANKHRKRCSIYVIKDRQVKTRYDFSSNRLEQKSRSLLTGSGGRVKMASLTLP